MEAGNAGKHCNRKYSPLLAILLERDLLKVNIHLVQLKQHVVNEPDAQIHLFIIGSLSKT